MTDYIFIKDYKDNDKLRLSFNQLANRTFGLNFEQWYQQGYWNERYICYSYLHNDHIVANISVNLMDVIHTQQEYRAIQIGTVMTDPAYRNQGLSKKLMDIVIAEYESRCSFMYLYANHSVLSFYPKFGFTKVIEPTFSIDLASTVIGKGNCKKLNMDCEEDWILLLDLYATRIPISDQWGVKNAEAIFTFYCLNVFHDDIYYLEDSHMVVIYQQEDQTLHLYDVISSKSVRVIEMIELLPIVDVNKVIAHYYPADSEINMCESDIQPDDTLFIYPWDNRICYNDMKLPKIAQA